MLGRASNVCVCSGRGGLKAAGKYIFGRYKTQDNYRYKAYDEYRYVHCALLALGNIRASECIVLEHLLISCATGSGHIRMMDTVYARCWRWVT